MPDRREQDMNHRLAGYVDWAIRGLIVASCLFVWKMYESQQSFLREISSTNMRVTQLEKDIARVEGNMVTIDTLKRVEIYMELVLAKSGVNGKIELMPKKGEK